MVESLKSTLEPGRAPAHRIEVVDLTQPAREGHPLFLAGLAIGFAYVSGRMAWRALRSLLWRRRQGTGPQLGPYRT